MTISRIVVYLNFDEGPTAEAPEIYGESDQSYSRLL